MADNSRLVGHGTVRWGDVATLRRLLPTGLTQCFSDNPWLQGEKSPHALLDEKQVREVLDDWDDEKGYWRSAAGHWGKLLKVLTEYDSRGLTRRHLETPIGYRCGCGGRLAELTDTQEGLPTIRC